MKRKISLKSPFRNIAKKAIFCYHARMKDFIEIMNHCGYDLERASEMAKEICDVPDVIEEILREAGLESLKEAYHEQSTIVSRIC